MIETVNNITKNAFLIIVLTILLLLMTYTLSSPEIIPNTYKINLNDGKPIIDDEGATFKPGDMLTKYFFIENMARTELTYNLYFENVEGSLKDVLEVKIYDQDEVVLSGILSEITEDANLGKELKLTAREKKVLKVEFYFPKTGGNFLKGSAVYFDLKARAEWSK